MNDLHGLESLAGQYADAHESLVESVAGLNTEIEALKRRRLPAIRRHVRATAVCHDVLRAEIAASREMFKRPRTRVLAGVKIGLAKQRGKVGANGVSSRIITFTLGEPARYRTAE